MIQVTHILYQIDIDQISSLLLYHPAMTRVKGLTMLRHHRTPIEQNPQIYKGLAVMLREGIAIWITFSIKKLLSMLGRPYPIILMSISTLVASLEIAITKAPVGTI